MYTQDGVNTYYKYKSRLRVSRSMNELIIGSRMRNCSVYICIHDTGVGAARMYHCFRRSIKLALIHSFDAVIDGSFYTASRDSPFYEYCIHIYIYTCIVFRYTRRECALTLRFFFYLKKSAII